MTQVTSFVIEIDLIVIIMAILQGQLQVMYIATLEGNILP